MNTEIKVTFSALSAAQGDVASAAARMNTQLEDLKRFLAPMVATWHGEAAQDYQVKQGQWNTAAKDITEVLRQIGVALASAEEAYRRTELSNASRWRR